MRNNNSEKPMIEAIPGMKAAFAAGRLSQYKPLASSGAESVQSTCAASWGPAMRR